MRAFVTFTATRQLGVFCANGQEPVEALAEMRAVVLRAMNDKAVDAQQDGDLWSSLHSLMDRLIAACPANRPGGLLVKARIEAAASFEDLFDDAGNERVALADHVPPQQLDGLLLASLIDDLTTAEAEGGAS